ncbi:hypothetical protein HII13_001495 [Brettanomyces bruxellensis]|uniref:DEBR0S3_15258g1_1 n=1 Tax=Dekkera bruxellensis TaxID=5007 RepID=A0A7D9H3A3_DEKBR|nr:uncharacterized protein BRETT_003894 [Brettanomyces bruxellensis]KAF6012445.1 hypothetical protein HII13_001495 [Brettanomyces bruxellensis]QOU19741.1 hypothetical protein BRETT_003894 [Brettanomyces bruxellensis]VUG18589.1 DEBR0S3_15258g1_1 [Brettanomyces bruxellensis]
MWFSWGKDKKDNCHCDKHEKCDMKKCDMKKCDDKKCDMKKDDGKPKPCCVCLDEKDARDKCILLKGNESPDCEELVAKYKKCMAGYGFKI